MPVRIEGVTLPDNKRTEISLTYIKGVGRNRSQTLLRATGIDFNKRVKDLTEDEVGKIRQEIAKQGWLVEGELQRSVFGNVKRLKEIGAWRGARHSRHLPARGQRTKTNSRTVRGNVRKTATSGKKPSAQKT